MKKGIISIFLLIGIVFGILFVGPGFTKNTSVYIDKFDVEENEMTIHVGVSSSIGYVRKYSMHQDGTTLYLDFYHGFGGINGSIGAKNTYIIPLTNEITDIAINRDEGYQIVIHKDEYNNWK